MDTSEQIKQYEGLITQFLAAHQDEKTETEDYHRSMVVDRENNHYQLVANGWITPTRYVDSLLIHLHIKSDGKVWLMENSTDLHVAEELVSRGIAKTDIVLAFHPPQYRALSGYATT